LAPEGAAAEPGLDDGDVFSRLSCVQHGPVRVSLALAVVVGVKTTKKNPSAFPFQA
jgi:hypothetical protein